MSRTAREERDVPGLPSPNSIALVFTTELPDVALISSSFGLVFSEAGFLMTNLRSRGWDIPGGHIEPDESPHEAVVREVREETGVEVRIVSLIGYQRIRIDGPVPDGYRYPLPESYQVFFLASPVLAHDLAPTLETAGARFWPIDAARQQAWVELNPELFEEALSLWTTV